MSESVRLVLMPVLIGLGAWVNFRFQAGSTLVAKIAVLTTLSMTALLFITGITVRTAVTHRSVAHLFARVGWVLILFAVGVSLMEALRSQRWSQAIHVVALVLALGAMFAAENTGYLGRLSDKPADILRFRLVHEALTPGAFALLLVGWLRLSRSYGEEAA